MLLDLGLVAESHLNRNGERSSSFRLPLQKTGIYLCRSLNFLMVVSVLFSAITVPLSFTSIRRLPFLSVFFCAITVTVAMPKSIGSSSDTPQRVMLSIRRTYIYEGTPPRDGARD
uniref:Uncharacterized protein n=1 Tax=Spongospora subterranea TaxID=70186 RepID=A0A0H5QHU5_9EUKA|eukprot:CRZ01548.1 hypothetical protein [Spongospora subterranea]